MLSFNSIQELESPKLPLAGTQDNDCYQQQRLFLDSTQALCMYKWK